MRERIQAVFPQLEVEVLTRSSRGDTLANVPLQTVEGTDFFTAEIFQALQQGEADIAVHSLKDMSSAHFFSDHCFAVPDREVVHDVVIFSNAGRQKVRQGQPLLVGTCSPRREVMATSFLQKALPFTGVLPEVKTAFIRGNVDTRLRKLKEGQYDAIILAAAGLHRLLQAEATRNTVEELLEDTSVVWLPLIDCVPAPCQGAIVAEAIASNKRAAEVVNAINNPLLFESCVQEKKLALQYGAGCDQRFGVASFGHGEDQFLFAAGHDQQGRDFQYWNGLPQPAWKHLKLFSTTDYMGHFFNYKKIDTAVNSIEQPIVYVANYKAVNDPSVIAALKNKRVWAAGTRTWLQLARQGIWVEGCADAFGINWWKQLWHSPLLKIKQADVCLLTHESAVQNWTQQGWTVMPTYALQKKEDDALAAAMADADVVFWTSAEQYQLYQHYLKPGVQHACPAGETVHRLTDAGVTPLVFPHIKAFQQWKTDYTR